MVDLFKYYCKKHGYHSQEICPSCKYILGIVGNIFFTEDNPWRKLINAWKNLKKPS
jgi:hypothetical protein